MDCKPALKHAYRELQLLGVQEKEAEIHFVKPLMTGSILSKLKFPGNLLRKY